MRTINTVNGLLVWCCNKVVLVPCGITTQLSDSDKASLMVACDKLVAVLRDAGLRVKSDYRDNYSPGWKFNHWELKVFISLFKRHTF